MHELDWLADIQCIPHHLTLEDRASEPIRTAQLSTYWEVRNHVPVTTYC